jgi:hypothetical protein
MGERWENLEKGIVAPKPATVLEVSEGALEWMPSSAPLSNACSKDCARTMDKFSLRAQNTTLNPFVDTGLRMFKSSSSPALEDFHEGPRRYLFITHLPMLRTWIVQKLGMTADQGKCCSYLMEI